MASARYWRVIAFGTRVGGALELSEMQLYDANGRADAAATISCTHAPVDGALASLQDGSGDSSVTFAADAVRSGGFALQWDFGVGAAKDVIAVRLGGGVDVSLYPSRATVQYLDGTTWVTAFSLEGFVWPGVSTLEADIVFGDAYWPKVTALLHFNGANASTTITNEVPGGVSFTASGGAQISTAQSDFGGASLALDGSSGYVTGAAGASFDMGAVTADTQWCVEFSVRPASLPSGGRIIMAQAVAGSGGSGRGGWMLRAEAGKLTWWISAIPGAASPWIYTLTTSNVVLAAGVMCKVALCLVNGVPTIRIDGSAVAAVPNTSGGIWSTTPVGLDTTRLDYGLRIGAGNTDNSNPSVSGFFGGYIDELRCTKGVSRYAANYTTSVAEFPNSIGGQAFQPLPPRTRIDRCAVTASAGVGSHAALMTGRGQTARDIEFGGPGVIYGTTKTKGTSNAPTKARVVLQHQRSKLPVRETWSDPTTGYFEFSGIDLAQQFLTLAEDAAGNFRPVAANRLTPEVPA